MNRTLENSLTRVGTLLALAALSSAATVLPSDKLVIEAGRVMTRSGACSCPTASCASSRA